MVVFHLVCCGRVRCRGRKRSRTQETKARLVGLPWRCGRQRRARCAPERARSGNSGARGSGLGESGPWRWAGGAAEAGPLPRTAPARGRSRGSDADSRLVGRDQGCQHGPLVAAAGFQRDPGRPRRLQPSRRARHRPRRPRGLDGHVQLPLRHLDPRRKAPVGPPLGTHRQRWLHVLPCKCGAGVDGPGTSSGSGPASGSGRLCSLAVSHD